MKYRSLLLTWSILVPVLLYAQRTLPLQFEKIRGLSQNTVYSIYEDKMGFLWIATANGLNRYDGMEMRIYKPPFERTEGKMKGRIIRSALLEDKNSRMWFSTDMGVNCLNRKTQQITQHKLYARKNSTKTSEEVPNVEMFANPLFEKGNYLWLADAQEGLFALNLTNGNCVNYPVTVTDKDGNKIPIMYKAALGPGSKLWFASNKGLISFDMETKSWSKFLENESFYAITISGDTLYLGHTDAITWFDTKKLTHGLSRIKHDSNKPGGMVRIFYTDHHLNIWAGDQSGNIYQKSSGQETFNWRGNINGNNLNATQYPVYSLYADSSGHLWAGGDVVGLQKAKINTGRFKSFPAPGAVNSYYDLFVHSIFEDEDDRLWLGTFQNGLIILNKKTGSTSQVVFPDYDPTLLYGRSVPLIKRDAYGNLWTSNSGFLYVMEKNKKEFLSIKFPVPPNFLQTPQLWSMTEYEDGWLMATNTGMYLVKKQGNSYGIRITNGYRGTKITSVWKAPGGRLWIAPETGGITIVDAPDETVYAKKLFPGTNVKAICYDTLHKLVWISTTAGLIGYDPASGNYRLYHEDDGLMNTIVYSATPYNDALWLSTNGGLTKGIMHFSRTNQFPRLQFVNFGKADGLAANDFNTGAYHKGNSGDLYFGSSSGLTWFNPAEIESKFVNPEIQLIDLQVNDAVPDSAMAPEYITELSLPYHKNNVFFRFRGMDLIHPENIKYRYRLVEWDRDWVHSNTLNEVRYNNLPPGKYFFEVQAAANSGDWSNDVRTVSFKIHPPFWKTWWFYSGVILCLIVLLVFITRYFSQQALKVKVAELERQKEMDRERQRISREMHDDIGAGLTQITLMSESAKSNIKGGREMDDIAATSRNLVTSIGEIIWSLSPENKSLNDLMFYLREQLHRLLEYAGLDYTIVVPEDDEKILLTNEQRRNILLVTKEVVNNAIKHSHARNITVLATLEKNMLSFNIRDDGDGFTLPGKTGGNGLRNIRHRVEELKGDLIIDSQPGVGTCFIYTIPLNSTT